MYVESILMELRLDREGCRDVWKAEYTNVQSSKDWVQIEITYAFRKDENNLKVRA